MPEFTEEQKKVIAFGKGNLLVSAAAGSGKTAVLVERILRLVKDGEDMASFLIVTFTKAAAEELKERLHAALEKAAEDDERFSEALNRLPLAGISTIHSFCMTVLTRYFEKAGVEAKLRIASDAERTVLFERAMDNTLNRLYEDPEMLEALEKIGSSQQVRLNIQSLYKFLMCRPEPEKWLKKAEKDYDEELPDLTGAPWFVRECSAGQYGLKQAVKEAEYAYAFAQNSPFDDCRAMADFIRGDIELMRENLNLVGEKVVFPTWKRSTKKSEDLVTLQKKRDGYKKSWDEAYGKAPVLSPFEQKKMEAMAQPLHTLCDATRAFMKEYTRLKTESGIADYSDLEQLTLKLTEDESVCADLRSRYAHIFVDEYQDSSEIQETLLQRISRGDNVFHVGDVKQSIYGFRQSDPKLFLSEMERFGRNDGGSLISLNRNFRSAKNVLASTNLVFSGCMTKELAGMDYDENARLHSGRGDPGSTTRLVLLDKNQPSETAGDSGDESGEAYAAARLARELHGTPIKDKAGNEHPAKWSDIVILRRSVAGALPAFREAFAKAGIPFYASRGGSFYETPESMLALDVLWAVHNPLEDIHFLGALFGGGGFAAPEVAQMRVFGRGEFQEREGRRMALCVEDYAKGNPDTPLGRRAKTFLEKLEALRRMSEEASLSDLCAVMLEETGLYTRFAAMPKGKERVANLRSLPERAAEYDAAGLRLSDFLLRIEETGTGRKEEDVPAFSENDDAVRLMTVHQSKGLEFPIVIGCGLGASFQFGNDKGNSSYMVSHIWASPESGLALQYLDAEHSAVDGTLKTAAIAAQKRRENLQEEIRILYVLMTRARERLVLLGKVRSLEKSMEKWAENTKEPSCFLDLMMPYLLPHPDAAALRGAFGVKMEEVPDESKWEISVGTDAGTEETQAEEAVEEAASADEEYILELKKQLDFVYPFPEPSGSQKQSVTELVHGKTERFFTVKRPSFMENEEVLSGAGRGTAIHRCMEILDIDALSICSGLQAEIGRQIGAAEESARMTDAEAAAAREAITQIEGFFTSFIGKRMLSGAKVYREQPFQMRRAGSLVQGVIDLIVEDGDGAILVDYKTDRSGLDTESVRARHGQQVNLYREAAELAGLHIKQAVVYLFSTGSIVEIER